MKLPTDKKERLQVLILVGIGCVAVCYGLFVGVLRPVVDKHKERLTHIEQLDDDLRRARLYISQMMIERESAGQRISEILDMAVTNRCVLRPRLGNYLLVAAEILERHAADAGITLDSVREMNVSDVVKPGSRATPCAFRAYTVRASAKSGIHPLVTWIGKLEEENPFLCISGLSIVAQPRTPGQHDILVDVQWPIWADPQKPEELAARLADATQAGGATP